MRHQVSPVLDIATIDVITSLMLCLVALDEHEAAADLSERELRAASKQLAPEHPMIRELRERIKYLIE